MTFDRISKYINNNRLTINKAKTTILMIKQKHTRIKGPEPRIRTVNENREEIVLISGKSMRILGCNVQNNLAWQEHLVMGEKPLLGETRKKLGALKHLAWHIPQNCRKTLPNGIIIGKISYLISTGGGGTTPNYLRMVQVLLNNTARFVTGNNRRTSTKILMKKCEWINVTKRTRYFTMTNIWGIIWRQAPEHMSLLITTDDTNRIQGNQARLQTVQQGLRWRGTQQWNELD